MANQNFFFFKKIKKSKAVSCLADNLESAVSPSLTKTLLKARTLDLHTFKI